MKIFKLSIIVLFASFIFTLSRAYAFLPAQPADFDYGTNSLTLTYQDQKIKVDQALLESWQAPLQLPKGNSVQPAVNLDANLKIFFGLESPRQEFDLYNFRIDKIYKYLESLAPQFDQPAKEPKFTQANNVVTDFDPGQTGRRLETFETAFLIADALGKKQTEVGLKIAETAPKNSLEQINPYGIKELVAEGVSNFRGSPQNRRHNITVGTEKMKGILLAKGETFSFNDHLGEVDAEHGFLPELVIKRTGTVPEFGGGLCQVSSTTFRAAMNAGFPIVERRNHAYAVQYYSPQGTDATIYPGVVDLKFINDSPGYLLIWPYQKDSNTLVFDFYGTKDRRQVTLDKPDVYDKMPDGSMKATWTRHITVNGATKSETFKSVYQSPALFHHEQSFTIGPEFYVGPPPKKP